VGYFETVRQGESVITSILIISKLGTKKMIQMMIIVLLHKMKRENIIIMMVMKKEEMQEITQ